MTAAVWSLARGVSHRLQIRPQVRDEPVVGTLPCGAMAARDAEELLAVVQQAPVVAA